MAFLTTRAVAFMDSCPKMSASLVEETKYICIPTKCLFLEWKKLYSITNLIKGCVESVYLIQSTFEMIKLVGEGISPPLDSNIA